MGGGGDTPNNWLGTWGAWKSPPQRGIITYGVAPNRQRPFAGALHAAFFNTFRRSRAQVLYVIPPFIAAYYAMEWATERNHYLNSKAGRAELAASEE